MTMGAATIPDVLVSTDWVAQHLNDPNVRIVEVDVDTAAYDQGHVPERSAGTGRPSCATRWSATSSRRRSSRSCWRKSGIGNDTTVVLYGDNNNWFAAWALWQFKIYGHKDVRLMNGGRKKWLEEGRELGSQTPVACRRPPTAPAAADLSIRAFLPEVQAAVKAGRAALVDVRSPAGVHRRDPRAARTARDVPARRPHPRRQEHPLGQGLQRRRHVQERRRSEGSSTAARA